jgi:hypothetical protein
MTAILAALRRAFAWVARVARRLTTRTTLTVRAARARLADRWHADSTYRRTIVAALSALSATLLPHPAAAAALGALVADHPSRTHHRSGRELFLEDYDEDDYPPRRPSRPTDPWAPTPRRLWDTLDN